MLSAAHDASGKDVHVPTNNKNITISHFIQEVMSTLASKPFVTSVYFFNEFFNCDYRMLHLGYSV